MQTNLFKVAHLWSYSHTLNKTLWGVWPAWGNCKNNGKQVRVGERNSDPLSSCLLLSTGVNITPQTPLVCGVRGLFIFTVKKIKASVKSCLGSQSFLLCLWAPVVLVYKCTELVPWSFQGVNMRFIFFMWVEAALSRLEPVSGRPSHRELWLSS